jgi:FtsP/CotA-like multicopper oxidase with cupredoxin domain
MMKHPMHLHNVDFVVLERCGCFVIICVHDSNSRKHENGTLERLRPEDLAEKDTVYIGTLEKDGFFLFVCLFFFFSF